MIHVIVLAAGSGSRLGGPLPKQLVDLGGRPLLSWSLETLVSVGVDRVVVTAPVSHLDEVADTARQTDPGVVVVAGGASRADSTRRGLETVTGADDDIVLVHDAARPFVSRESVVALIERLATFEAATLAVPAADTIVEAHGDKLSRRLDRSTLYHVQTPQGFRLGVLRKAHREASEQPALEPTDDAGLVREVLGVEVALVTGSPLNLKVTTEADLVRARAIAATFAGDRS